MSIPLPDALAAALADRYRVDRSLGRGGMATVYLAWDLRHDRPVALKTLHPDLAATLGPDRFHREIRLTARLQHPHILTVLDSGESHGLLWYTMPYVEGESLRALLQRERQLGLEQALKIVREVADGLTHAHQHGIVHRDIKPENILLSGGHALLADFGIARSVGASTETRLTETGITVGTPAYMSPEQALGEVTDPRSDIYSLGCVLHELLAGDPPFSGGNAQALLAARMTTRPKALRELRDGVPEAVEQAALRAMAPAPADRFSTAAEFARALTGPLGPAQSRVLEKSIAVLPFSSLSSDPEDQFFSDGMTEELIGALTRLEGLHVVSRTSVFAFKGRQEDIRSIGAQLNVRTVLEGSVRRAGRRLRVAVQLTDVTDGFHLWSETYDRELEDVFAIQEEISQAVVNALRIRLLGEASTARLVRRPTDDLEAYTAYLKGRTFWDRRSETDVRKALECFQQALTLDPQYALAHSGIADCYAVLGYYCMMPPTEAFPGAKASALKAIEHDPGLAEPHATLGYVAMYHDWNWPAAEREFRVAIGLNPGYSTAHQWYGMYLALMGRIDDCAGEFDRSESLDPLSGLKLATAGVGYYFGHRWHESISHSARAIDLEPTLAVAHWWLALASEQLGDLDRSITAAEEGLRNSQGNSIGLAILARVLVRAGRLDRAKALLDELLALERRRYVASYDIATVLLALERREETLDRLDRALAERDHWMVSLRSDPRLDPLRSVPRFRRLLAEMGLPD